MLSGETITQIKSPSTKPEMKLSKNKQAYTGKISYMLAAKDLPSIIQHYEQKNHIKIIINGQKSSSIILKKINDFKDQIIGLQDDKRNYALYLQKHLCSPCEDSFYIGNLNCPEISAYLTPNGKIKEDLSENELLALNKISKAKFTHLLDAKIKEYISYLRIMIDDVCLEKSEAIAEIKQIQASLKSDEIVGYIWTSNHRKGSEHFEVLLLSAEAIIKPVQWGPQANNGLYGKDLPGLFDCILPLEKRQIELLPQAGNSECGTLGMMYLNELLKDNAKQLKEFALSFSYYDKTNKFENLYEFFSLDKNNELKHFFFPSPQSLRFSQSSAYNKVLKAMLTDETTNQLIEHRDKQYKVKTIKSLLKESILAARNQGNEELAKKNQQLLDNLSDFSQRWLAEYEVMAAKRAQLDITLSTSQGMPFTHNHYLAYTTQRMKEKANDEKLQFQSVFI